MKFTNYLNLLVFWVYENKIFNLHNNIFDLQSRENIEMKENILQNSKQLKTKQLKQYTEYQTISLTLSMLPCGSTMPAEQKIIDQH